METLLRDCDSVLTLADGRNLGYATYGDPAGRTVMYFHGGMSSRIDATSCATAAREAGLCVVAPDRPGIGLSDRHKRASLLDWPSDVLQLANHLGAERFAVLGWSFGGAYAAACGSALPERVASTGLIASGIPIDWPGMIEQINRMDRRFLKLANHAGIADEGAFLAIRSLALHAPEKFVQQTVASLSDQSRQAIMRDPDEFVAATVAAFAHPAGALDDYRIWNQPWGFDVADIRGPVEVWHGSNDELCPATWGQRLAAAIPTGHLHLVEGAGHFVARDHWPEILTSLNLD